MKSEGNKQKEERGLRGEDVIPRKKGIRVKKKAKAS